MTKNNLYHGAWKLRATGVLVLALALSTFPAAFSRVVKAQAPAKATAQTPAKATTAPATESKGGQKEGIKVHGHWTIDVRNPDGTLVTHREFENELEPTNWLPLILGRQRTVGEWEIQLSDTATPDNSPCNLGNIIVPCSIVEPTSASNTSIAFKTLTLSVPSSIVPDVGTVYVLVLSGTATAMRAGQVKRVSTHLSNCAPTIPASSCIGSVPGSIGTVTSKVLAIPIGTSAGQIIQVKVTISFS